MKRIIYMFLCFIVLFTCSCTSDKNREDGYIDLQEVYKKNIEEAMMYYEPFFPDYTDYGLINNDSLFSACNEDVSTEIGRVECEKYFYIKRNGLEKMIIYEFETSSLAQNYYKKHDKDIYSVMNNIVYGDTMGSYVLLNGSPIYIEGIYYDAKDKGIILRASTKITKCEFKDVTKIITMAFVSAKLEGVKDTNKLEYIGYGAFLDNKSLSKIKLNEGLKHIGGSAFEKCPNLKDAVIPSTVNYIGENAFECSVLYCNVESKPAGWDKKFCSENTKVYWKGEWEYDKDGIPSPINAENPDAALNL